MVVLQQQRLIPHHSAALERPSRQGMLLLNIRQERRLAQIATYRPDQPRVAIVLLNWNAWGDCIECMESVLRQDYRNFTILLCDNGSTEGSLEIIQDWAEGKLCAVAEAHSMAEYSTPPVAKPIALHGADDQGGIVVLRSEENLGFAGGNNIAIRHAMAADYEYVWLLNTDTVVDPGALRELVKRMQALPEAGLCGSLLCYYDAPDTIQEVGGCAYVPSLGLAKRLAGDAPRFDRHDWRALERKLEYVSAASCLASRRFLEEVGVLSEDYFLYCEEIDWATRNAGRFHLVVAEESVVYHKKGRASGSKSVNAGRSAASAYYLWRARRRFTRKYHCWALPSVLATGLAAALIELLQGRRSTAGATLRGLFDR